MILSSRADSPSGIGYALENRIVVRRVFPELFGDMQVQRLASFFSTYREHVLSLANGRGGRAVLLTPGPHNEAYFEHAYLAHYLGLTLVEGDDLAVRDSQVFLKTLAGLERVAVIFRRMDSDFCDPLELRRDSALGIPGLVQAVRHGNVVLANALGGGVMESPAIDAYLPGMCRALLDEDLKIPDIPTVWCGTEWGAKEALSRLDRAVVRDAFDARPLFSRQSSGRLASELSPADIKALRTRIESRGATVVTQDYVPLGLAPVYKHGRFSARPVSLRVFAAWTSNGYVVMPGGLVRVARTDRARELSIQSGAASKDVWIVGREPADALSLLRPGDSAIDIRRTGQAPPSRAMDNLFWLGRYSERAESLVRILRGITARLTDDIAFAADSAARILNPHAPGSAAAIRDSEAGSDETLRTELHTLLYERNSPDGLQNILARVRQTAWAGRDRLSLDTWRVIHGFTEHIAPGEGPAEDQVYLDSLIRAAAAFSGLCAEDMTRGPNWLFVDLGRRVERASQLVTLVRQAMGEVTETEVGRIRLVLEVADSAMTYRSRYLNHFDVAALIDLVLLDEGNPRAVAFQLAAIERNLKELPFVTQAQQGQGALAIAGDARLRVFGTQAHVLAEPDEQGKRSRLLSFAAKIEDAMAHVNDAITDAYFQHTFHHRTGAAPPREEA